jgi:hypothetical protein
MLTILRVNGNQFYFYAEEANESLQFTLQKATLMPNSGCRPRDWRSITDSGRMIYERLPGSSKNTKR